jgi:hypothetical protein
MKNTFSIDTVTNKDSPVPEVSAKLNLKELLGAIMVKWGIDRIII